MTQLSSRSIKTCCLLAFVSLAAISSTFANTGCVTPQANNDTVTTHWNFPLTIYATANDRIVGNSSAFDTTAKITVKVNAVHGTAVKLNNDSILYTPIAGFFGVDSFTYLLWDTCTVAGVLDTFSTTATVYLTIDTACPKPRAVKDSFAVFNNLAANLFVERNDTANAPGLLALTLVSGPLHGSATLKHDTIAYTGIASYSGFDTILYSICNFCGSCDTNIALLNVTGSCVHAKLVWDTSVAYTLKTDTVDVLANDTLFGMPIISFSTKNGKHGTTAIVNGKMVYTSTDTFNVKDTVKYFVCTPCFCDSSFVVFKNTTPCSKPKAHDLADLRLGYSPNCPIKFNPYPYITNPPYSGNVIFRILTSPVHGKDTMIGNKVIYTHTDTALAHRTTAEVLQYEACNDCFCDTAFIYIFPQTDSCNGWHPVVLPDSGHVCMNDSIVINVTANDYDPDSGGVYVDSIGSPNHGWAYIVDAAHIKYVPYPNYSGYDQFYYQANDYGSPRREAGNLVRIWVDSCAHAPEIVDNNGHPTDTIYITFPEDSNYIYCIQYTDADNDTAHLASLTSRLHYSRTITNRNPPCIHFIPDSIYRGTDTFTAVICDRFPLCDTVTIIVHLTPISHTPEAVNDTGTVPPGGSGILINILNNDKDPDHDPLTPAILTTTKNGTLILDSVTHSVSYTPNANFAGYDTATYVICNQGHLCDSASIFITISVKARIDSGSAGPDTAVTIAILQNDNHTAGAIPMLCDSNGGAHNSASVIVNPDGTITYTPTKGATGVDTFCYYICLDSVHTQCDTAKVFITIGAYPPLFIPEGFSPDGDGLNDKFVIQGISRYPNSQVIIFNRWGEEVWRNDGNGYVNDFDGTWKKNGSALPDGTYYYIVKFNDNIRKDQAGFVMINR